MRRSRASNTVIGTVGLVVVVVGTALAAGGSGSKSAGSSAGVAGPRGFGAVKAPVHRMVPAAPGEAAPLIASPRTAVAQSGGAAAAGGVGSVTGAGASVGAPAGADVASADAVGVTATRIVKTGSLDLRVTKGAVQSTMTKLSELASSKGGYVARSTADSNANHPSGQIELRVPVGQFAATVAAAEALGHVETLTTSAQDVTGRYVDLSARKRALERTRATYLSILSRATTIGATLAVQQRIEDVQQQIDELHGELKLLASQSAFSTLDVAVDQPAIVLTARTSHSRHGLGAAWHRSISRFNRGIDAIVGALGPLLLAVLLIGIAVLVVRVGRREVRRHRSSDATG